MKKILVILVILTLVIVGFTRWNRIEEETYSNEHKVQTATFYRVQKKLVYKTFDLIDDTPPTIKVIFIDEIEDDSDRIIYSSSHYEYVAYDKINDEWWIR